MMLLRLRVAAFGVGFSKSWKFLKTFAPANCSTRTRVSDISPQSPPPEYTIHHIASPRPSCGVDAIARPHHHIRVLHAGSSLPNPRPAASHLVDHERRSRDSEASLLLLGFEIAIWSNSGLEIASWSSSGLEIAIWSSSRAYASSISLVKSVACGHRPRSSSVADRVSALKTLRG